MKAAVFAIMASWAPLALAAEVFVISDNNSGVPEFETLSAPELVEVPEIGGDANTGFSYAQLWAGLEGFQVFKGRIQPQGKIVSHDGPETYVAYIVSGSGTMGNDGPNGDKVSSFKFGPGDVIVFGPDTMHHWEVDDEEVVFIGFQRH